MPARKQAYPPCRSRARTQRAASGTTNISPLTVVPENSAGSFPATCAGLGIALQVVSRMGFDSCFCRAGGLAGPPLLCDDRRSMIAGWTTLSPEKYISGNDGLTRRAARIGDAARPAPVSRRSGPTPAAGSVAVLECLSPMPSGYGFDDNTLQILPGAARSFAR